MGATNPKCPRAEYGVPQASHTWPRRDRHPRRPIGATVCLTPPHSCPCSAASPRCPTAVCGCHPPGQPRPPHTRLCFRRPPDEAGGQRGLWAHCGVTARGQRGPRTAAFSARRGCGRPHGDGGLWAAREDGTPHRAGGAGTRGAPPRPQPHTAPHRPADPSSPLMAAAAAALSAARAGGAGRRMRTAPPKPTPELRGAAALRRYGTAGSRRWGAGRDTGTWEGDGDTDWKEIWGRLGAGRLGRGGTGTWGGMGTGAWGKGTLGNGMGTGEQGRGQRHWEWGEEWGAGTLKAWGQAGGRETGNGNRDMGRGARGGMGTGTRGQGHGEWGEDRDVGTRPGQDGDRDTGNGIGMGT